MLSFSRVAGSWGWGQEDRGIALDPLRRTGKELRGAEMWSPTLKASRAMGRKSRVKIRQAGR